MKFTRPLTPASCSRALIRPWLFGWVSLLLVACQTPPPTPTPPTPVFSAAQVMALKDMGFVEDAAQWVLNFSEGRILFDSGIDALSAKGMEAVGALAKGLKKIQIARVRVEGHTDNVGSLESNQTLSQRRALNVASQMVAMGFQDDKVAHQGFGQTKPIADNSTAQGRAQNRRVSLIVVAE